ncbi:hypothetical protein IF1G_06296 [Cordyceps javanica]|uniref:Uncharacterized protein n=1 Tax=Cordyceps javanica TaxID=43265 RepID=A0A545V0U8_9HYPO|nr:hypothetical protein IF1G_06296 [Cordyceps javanica]TQW05497.1 hypothetical protein IF2G_06619 [Cordyceps javanica]
MAAHTAGYHIAQHPTNIPYNTDYRTGTNKEWARQYKPIRNLVLHSRVDEEGLTEASFDNAFLPLFDDDGLRMSQPCVAPNTRSWRFEVEADCEHWFHAEISNIVLSAWATYPPVLQSSHNKPLSETAIPENVDSTYSVRLGNNKHAIAIGEMKRNLIHAQSWQAGWLVPGAQQMLSQELRGYAHKYKCPQVYCFDGKTLLLLQFRAVKFEAIEDENCPVDCWVLQANKSRCTLRYALYRLLAQGWRREFYSGRPIWSLNEANRYQTEHPYGYQRSVDQATGALKWTHAQYPDCFESSEVWGASQ